MRAELSRPLVPAQGVLSRDRNETPAARAANRQAAGGAHLPQQGLIGAQLVLLDASSHVESFQRSQVFSH